MAGSSLQATTGGIAKGEANSEPFQDFVHGPHLSKRLHLHPVNKNFNRPANLVLFLAKIDLGGGYL